MNSVDKKKLLYLPSLMPVKDILISDDNLKALTSPEKRKDFLRTDISSKKIKHSENRKPIFSSPKINSIGYIKALKRNEMKAILDEKLPKLETKSMDFTKIKTNDYISTQEKHTSPPNYLCSPIKIYRRKVKDSLKDFYIDVDRINNVHDNYVKDIKFEIYPRYMLNIGHKHK